MHRAYVESLNQERVSTAMERDYERALRSVVSIQIQLIQRVLGNSLFMIREKQFSGLILQTLLRSQIQLCLLLLGHLQTTTGRSGYANSAQLLVSSICDVQHDGLVHSAGLAAARRVTLENYDDAYAQYVASAGRVRQMYRWRY